MADRGFSDLLSSASSLLNSQSHSSNPSQGHASSADEGTGKPHSSSSGAHKPSYGEVYSSAQIVMDAAKSKLHKTNASSAEDVSYGKLAGAAGTLIGAATHYGKLEQSGIGKYANKAQEYLHSYEIKHGKPGMNVPPSQPSAPHNSSGYGQDNPPASAQTSVNHSQPSAPPYPAGYPPQGYPDTQQNYGYAQGHSKPAESHANVDNYPPVGYPPAGYPTSGGNYNRPSKYS